MATTRVILRTYVAGFCDTRSDGDGRVGVATAGVERRSRAACGRPSGVQQPAAAPRGRSPSAPGKAVWYHAADRDTGLAGQSRTGVWGERGHDQPRREAREHGAARRLLRLSLG